MKENIPFEEPIPAWYSHLVNSCRVIKADPDEYFDSLVKEVYQECVDELLSDVDFMDCLHEEIINEARVGDISYLVNLLCNVTKDVDGLSVPDDVDAIASLRCLKMGNIGKAVDKFVHEKAIAKAEHRSIQYIEETIDEDG